MDQPCKVKLKSHEIPGDLPASVRNLCGVLKENSTAFFRENKKKKKRRGMVKVVKTLKGTT